MFAFLHAQQYLPQYNAGLSRSAPSLIIERSQSDPMKARQQRQKDEEKPKQTSGIQRNNERPLDVATFPLVSILSHRGLEANESLLNETLVVNLNSEHLNETISDDVENSTLTASDNSDSNLVFHGCLNELTTTFEDNLGSYGNMFDIYTYGAIQVYGIDIYTDVTKSIDYEIYTKLNPFSEDQGKETLEAWTLLTAGTTVGKGRQNPTPILGFDELTILPETTMGFYVTLKSPDLRYRDIRAEMPDGIVGDIYKKNEDLEIRIGASVSEYPFNSTSFFGKRAWSGTLHYVPDGGCPSAMPSSHPSAMPSSQPSPMQSFPPSMVFSTMPSITAPSLSPSSIYSEVPSAVPSKTMTFEPTRVAFELGPCTEEGTLETTVAGGTGAYGSMFTVTSHNSSVAITSLSFHTDFTERPVTVQVFTKANDFVGFENIPEAWTQISESVVFGAGAGLRTKIPPDKFDTITMYASETRAFYITLTTADFRYSRTNTTIGEPVSTNQYISVNAGAGLADYPFATKFFIYEPREFNGAVHFETTSECLPTGDVSYAFHVFHTPGMREVDVIRIVNESVDKIMQNKLDDDPTVKSYVKTKKLKLVQTNTTIVDKPCKPFSETFDCKSVEIKVTLKYAPTARWGEIKYIFLKFYEDVTLNVNLEFKAEYVGDIPVEQGTLFKLGSSSSALKKMTAKQSAAFELAILDFLEGPLRKKGVNPLGVKITVQGVGDGDGQGRGRRRQRSSGGSIDISTTITGEYRPPPDIDYDGVVSDALDSNNPDLEKRINRADKYFEVVDSVKASSDKVHRTEPELTSPEIPRTANAKFPIVPVASGVGGFFAFLFVFWYCKRRRKRNEAEKWNQQLNLTSDVLDTGGGMFGGLLGDKKTHKNFDYAGDAEVTGWAVPSTLNETYDKQRRDWKHDDESVDEYPSKQMRASSRTMDPTTDENEYDEYAARS